ncbi:MAG: FG-GAP-like repeat-containing protein [Blastocatellia bacterium]
MGACPVGACSLRAAVEQGNFLGGAQQINFNIQVAGVPTIPGGTYSIGVTAVINGASQPGGLVEITGTNALPVNIFTGSQTDNCVFRGLVINGVGGNYYMNPQGINNIFEGNRVGTNAAGTAASGSPVNNTGGIAAQGANLIGGTTAAARNIISTGTGEGVAIYGRATGNPNRMEGNFIGTDITGTVALGNFGNGVRIQGENLTVGGTTAGAGNVICATTGDAFFGASGISGSGGDGGGIGRLIQGNRIGTNAAGTAALGNARFGIEGSTGTPFDTIGGVNPAARNIISGNGLAGIQVSTTGGSALNPIIAGNFVGTNAAGSGAIPNGGFGISFGGSITTPVSNNLVSGNTGGGIQFCNSIFGNNNVVTQNLIGTDATGNNPLGNGGVGLSTACGGAVGNGSITNNTIAANGSHGVLVDGGFNLNFQDNFIGTNVGGSLNLGNGGDGIRFANAFSNNNVTFNRITRNAGKGVNLATGNIFSVNNFIAHNRIWDNGGLGIDLGGDGVTPNDHCDAENGTNNLQNYPVISIATRRGNNIRISGTFNSAVNPNYVLQFYGNDAADPSGFGEGQRSFGQINNVAVPAGCQMTFTATVPATLSSARCVSATATDTDGNTSEFSRCAPIRTVANSFDNDGRADVSIFRPSNGEWWYLRSADGVVNAATFGVSTDRITPGDWTGDGISDLAFWRPSTGQWFILRSEDFSFFAFPFGANGDIPAPGDFDGDGKFDAAVFRPATTTWFILRSSDAQTTITPFGLTQDRPIVADYDGDGLDDIAIFRPNVGEWWYRRSSDGGASAVQFGSSTDIPVQGDYTGDGKADIAFWRPSTGFWFILRSEDSSFFAFPWGANGDIPAPSDYDGDSRIDTAVFRPSSATWFLNQSSDGISIVNFGLTGDRPVPSAYIP